jgi:hypothetical protein
MVAEAGGDALKSAGIPAGDTAIEALLRAVLDIQDEQSQALARIDENVQRLVDGPWNSAWMYIREASLPGSDVEERRMKLEHASEKLHEAVPLQAERSFGRAYANLDLAVVLHILNDIPASRLYAHNAVDAAVGYLTDVKANKAKPPELQAIKLRRGAQWGLSKTMATLGYPVGKPLLHRLDERTNDWLMHIYEELSGVGNGAALLCGPDDDAVVRSVAQAPLNLRCRDGEIAAGPRLWT